MELRGRLKTFPFHELLVMAASGIDSSFNYCTAPINYIRSDLHTSWNNFGCINKKRSMHDFCTSIVELIFGQVDRSQAKSAHHWPHLDILARLANCSPRWSQDFLFCRATFWHNCLFLINTKKVKCICFSSTNKYYTAYLLASFFIVILLEINW